MATDSNPGLQIYSISFAKLNDIREMKKNKKTDQKQLDTDSTVRCIPEVEFTINFPKYFAKCLVMCGAKYKNVSVDSAVFNLFPHQTKHLEKYRPLP